MKRLLSVVFLLLIFLNAIGYYGLLLLARQRATSDILRKIDENVNMVSGNMILRVPLSIPYCNGSQEYKRMDGEISYGGDVYRLVKECLHNDALYIVCIRDEQTTELNQSISDYFKSFGTQSEEDHPGSKLIGTFIKDYVITRSHTKHTSTGWCRSGGYKKNENLYRYNFHMVVFHPPQMIS